MYTRHPQGLLMSFAKKNFCPPEFIDVLLEEESVEVGTIDDREPHVHEEEAKVAMVLKETKKNRTFRNKVIISLIAGLNNCSGNQQNL